MKDISINQIYEAAKWLVAFFTVMFSFWTLLKKITKPLTGPIEKISSNIVDIKKEITEIKGDILELTKNDANTIRNTIIKSCREYIKNGKISFKERENLIELKKQYDKLVAKTGVDNGIIEDYFKQSMSLRIEEWEDKE